MSINAEGPDNLDDFWDNFEDSNRNYKLLIDFTPEVTEYTSTQLDLSSVQPKFKKKLTASTFVKRDDKKRGLF